MDKVRGRWSLRMICCAPVILADKGADVYELVYKTAGVDVLFKAPWGFRDVGALAGSAPNSQVAMVDHYAGGWQEILPNFAAASFYRGVEWCFHGELLTAGLGLPHRAE